MKNKILSLLLLLVMIFCSACDNEAEESIQNIAVHRDDIKESLTVSREKNWSKTTRWAYSEIEIKGHHYIILEKRCLIDSRRDIHGLGLVHDPDCPLCKIEKEKLKIIKGD